MGARAACAYCGLQQTVGRASSLRVVLINAQKMNMLQRNDCY